MAGVSYIEIKSLTENTKNCFLVGVIIAKQAPKIILSKRDNSERSNWGFTLRDSPNDCINVSLWGDQKFVFEISDNFRLGDVVELANPRIQRRRVGEQNDMYAPAVSSLFQLTFSSSTSLLQYEGDNYEELKTLFHCLSKPSCEFFTLADIHSNGGNMGNECVNLLAAVRRVGPIRQITTKDGREMVCRDISVLDQTNSSLALQLWNAELVHRADYWEPRETILFLADVKVQFNAYRQQMAASDGPRTIVTENPTTAEADTLRQYARTVPFKSAALIDSLAKLIPDPNSIRNVMTLKQLLDRSTKGSADNSGGNDAEFTALIYCVLTKLDLDGSYPVVTATCSECSEVAPSASHVDPVCKVRNTRAHAVLTFDIRVSLTDHTGSVDGCRLIGEAAEKVLGCSAETFLRLPLDRRTELKWRFLLERCSTRVLVLRARGDQPAPLVSILSCAPADPTEVSAKMPVY